MRHAGGWISKTRPLCSRREHFCAGCCLLWVAKGGTELNMLCVSPQSYCFVSRCAAAKNASARTHFVSESLSSKKEIVWRGNWICNHFVRCQNKLNKAAALTGDAPASQKLSEFIPDWVSASPADATMHAKNYPSSIRCWDTRFLFLIRQAAVGCFCKIREFGTGALAKCFTARVVKERN